MEGTCNGCNKSKGLVLSCDYINCDQKYHPRCAVKAKVIEMFERMCNGPCMTKVKDQPKPAPMPDGNEQTDPCLFLYEDRVCTLCPTHQASYSEVAVERRMSVLKTRPLKNPFVVCGKIISKTKAQLVDLDSQGKTEKFKDKDDEAFEIDENGKK